MPGQAITLTDFLLCLYCSRSSDKASISLPCNEIWDMKRITRDAWLFHSYMHKLCSKTQWAAYSDNILRHHSNETWTERQAATLCFLLKANSHCADRHTLTATGTLSGFIGSVCYLLVLVCACFRQLNRSWNVYKCLLAFWLAIFFYHAFRCLYRQLTLILLQKCRATGLFHSLNGDLFLLVAVTVLVTPFPVTRSVIEVFA